MLITKPSCLAPALLALAACGAAPVEHEPLAPVPARAPAPIPAADERGDEPMTNGSALALWCAGAERLFADPRDAGLRRAFASLDDRLIEFAQDDPNAERGLRLLAAAMAGPVALRVDVTGMEPLPVHVQLEVGGGDPAGAAALEREFERFLVEMGIGGMQVVEPPLDQLEHRVVGDGADARVVLSLGELDTRPLGLGSMDLPAGVAPTLALKLDLAQLWPLMEMAMAGEPDAEQMLRVMTALGVFGEDAIGIRAAFGQSGRVGHVAMRTTNYVPAMQKSGALERSPITFDEIGLIPTDAVSAAIGQSNPGAVLAYLEMFREEIGGDPLEMIHAMTGVHLERDLFDHLGTTAGWYTSDTTGGGGMMSAVLFVEVESEDDLRATLDHVLTALNDMAAMNADGHVETRDWMHGDALCTTLTFPGWPVPIEPSFAIDDGFLFGTLSPQALTAALEQRAARGPGLAANPAFRKAARGSLDDLTTLSFTDTARRARDGYGLATLVTAALANAVRAPEDTARDPGIVLPAYHALAGPSRATVVLGRIEGDDLVQIGTCDPSMAANLAAVCGSPILYVVGASLVPAMAMMVPLMMGFPSEAHIYAEPDWEWEEFDDESFEMSDDEAELLRLLDEMGELDASEEGTDDVLEQLRALGYLNAEEAVEEPLEETEAPETEAAEEPASEDTEEPAPEETDEPASDETEEPAPDEGEEPAPEDPASKAAEKP